MKSSMQFLVALVCIINVATAFVAPGARPLAVQRSVQRENLVLFQEPNTLEKEATKTEGKVEEEDEEEMSESQKLMKQVKDAGTAGIISYALWEWGFWCLSVPVCVFGYQQVTGHWPDFNDPEDQKKLAGEAFAFVNFARFAVPLRIGLALSTTPWIDENVVKRFFKKDEENEE